MIVEAIIAHICAGLVGNQYQACSKALEATAVECHVKQDAQRLEDSARSFAYRKALEITTPTEQAAIGAAVVINKIYTDRAVSYPILPNPRGIVPAVNCTVGLDRSSVQLRWTLK